MEIVNTKGRAKVEAIRLFSTQLVIAGKVKESMNWDAKSHWHNSKYIDLVNEQEWVIYLADQAFSGEVRVLKNSSGNT